MNFALAAITFGVAGGLKPGPLGIYIIHQTMSKGTYHGFVSSLAPILAEGPIILLALLLTLQLNDLTWFISLISIFGAVYLANIAYKIFKAPNSINPCGKKGGSSSFFTAVKINLLNPSPYIFWLTIGSSYLVMGSESDALIFIICAISSLCITKFGVAIAIKKLGDNFNPKVYSVVLKSLSLPLVIFSIQLLYSGLSVWL